MRPGIRFRTSELHDVAVPVVPHDKPLVEVYDVDTGEVLENVFDVTVWWPVSGVLEATVKLYPVEQKGFEPSDVQPKRRRGIHTTSV